MTWLTQEGFFSGEVSPRAYPLASAPHVQKGAKVMRNALLTGQGSVTKRYGSRHVAFTDTLRGDAITIPYKTTTGGKYAVVLTEKIGTIQVILKVLRDYSFMDFADTETHGPIPASDSTTHYVTPYTVAQIPEIHYFQSSDILFLLHPAHPPLSLERKLDATGNEVWEYGLAQFVDTSPQVETKGAGISLTLTSQYENWIDASAPIFVPEDVDTIWKFGGPSIDDFPGGAFFSVKEYRSPTRIQFRHGWLWPVVEDDWGLDATDWCGPFEKTSVYISGGSEWGGSPWVEIITGVSVSDGRPVDNRLLGTLLKRQRYYLIVGVTSSSSIRVLRLNTFGPSEPASAPAYLYEMGTRNGVKRPYYCSAGSGSNSFAGLLSNDGIVMSSGEDFLPEGHETHFDGPNGSATLGGTVFIQGGVCRVTSKNADGSYTFKSEGTGRSHLGPTFRLGIGMSPGAGFPSVGTNHQGRTVLSGYQGKYSENVTIGKAGEPLDFRLGSANAGDGFSLKALGEGAVNWVDSNRDLLVGTEYAEFRAEGIPITPEKTILLKTSAYGGKRCMPVRLGATTVFVGRSGKSLYQATYIDTGDTYDTLDLSDLADHLFVNDTISQIVMGSQPDVLVWVRFDSGKLCVLNWRPATDVTGWCSFRTGNTTLGGAGNAVNWISVLPSFTPGETHDNLWVVMDRTKNILDEEEGSLGYETVTYKAIEAFGRIYTMDQEITFDSIYAPIPDPPWPPANGVDGQLADGFSATLLVVDHLAGQTVQVVVDGVYLGDVTLSTGGVASPTSASANISHFGLASIGSEEESPSPKLTIGRPVFYELVPVVQETVVGKSQTHGKRRNYSRVLVYVQNTRGMRVEQYAIDSVPSATVTDVVPVLGGWISVPVITDFGTQPVITISQSAPYAIEVSAMNSEVSFGD